MFQLNLANISWFLEELVQFCGHNSIGNRKNVDSITGSNKNAKTWHREGAVTLFWRLRLDPCDVIQMLKILIKLHCIGVDRHLRFSYWHIMKDNTTSADATSWSEWQFSKIKTTQHCIYLLTPVLRIHHKKRTFCSWAICAEVSKWQKDNSVILFWALHDKGKIFGKNSVSQWFLLFTKWKKKKHMKFLFWKDFHTNLRCIREKSARMPVDISFS